MSCRLAALGGANLPVHQLVDRLSEPERAGQPATGVARRAAGGYPERTRTPASSKRSPTTGRSEARASSSVITTWPSP